jgi:hypothetical protein
LLALAEQFPGTMALGSTMETKGRSIGSHVSVQDLGRLVQVRYARAAFLAVPSPTKKHAASPKHRQQGWHLDKQT